MAFHNSLRPAAAGICLLLAAVAARADDPPAAAVPTPDEAARGWVALFDGETTFGLETTGGVTVAGGKLVIGGGKGGGVATRAAFGTPRGEVRVRGVYTGHGAATLHWQGRTAEYESGQRSYGWHVDRQPGGPSPVRIEVPAGGTFTIDQLLFRPADLAPLFDGKSLAGWKRFTGNPKQEKSVFAVTPAGELSVKDGPGDLQTEKAFADFLLHLECKTNGKALNSGVFFRCLPGQYQQGYEAQIQNAYVGDRTKPLDFGTGAIYRRVPARKVVSDDNEWFTLTVLAKGPHLATWVNGYPTVSWTDDRKPAGNARQGLYTKAGPLSVQGHDPTTDLLFRNIRIADLGGK
jgi:hypothetical protein